MNERGTPASDPEKPAFLANFPDDPELQKLVAAFEVGNYALVRKRAPELARRSEDRRVREAALELRRRIDPDPLARYLLVIAALLLSTLVAIAYLTEH